MSVGANMAAGRYTAAEQINSDQERPVFKAFDVLLNEWVIIKAVTELKAQFTSSILKEYQLLRRLNLPWLPKPLHLGRIPWQNKGARPTRLDHLVETWLGGTRLTQMLGKLNTVELQHLMIQLLEMVVTLQFSGISRLDLKPEHLIWYRGRWYLIDLDQVNQDTITQWEKAGTPAWAAHELLAGEPVDGRADLFSVAMIVWAAATGETPPMQGGTLAECARWLVRRGELPLPPLLEKLGETFCQVWRQMASVDLEQRPISAQAALKRLEVPLHRWRQQAHLPVQLSQTQLNFRDTLLNTLCSGPHPGLNLVGGPRSGRSTLLQLLHDTLIQRGEVCLMVQPRGEKGPIPTLWNYIPVVEQLRYNQQLVWRLPPVWSADGRPLDAQVAYLAEALMEAVGEEPEHPLILLVDDADQLDTVSRRALAALCARLGPGHVRVVLTGAAGDWSHDFLNLLPAPLIPLHPHEIRSLAESLTRSEIVLSQLEAEELREETGGAIGVVVANIEARWRGVGNTPVTPESEGPLELQELAPEQRKLARQLSILEGAFPWQWVHLLLGGKLTRELLADWVERGILSTLERDRWQFNQESLRLNLLASLPASERQELHARLADHLTDNPEATPLPQVVAHHLFHGGKSSRAARWYSRAADAATREHRPDRSALFLREVLRCLPEGDPDHAEITCRLAEAHLEAGEDIRATEVVEQSIHLPELDSAHLTRLRGVKGMALLRQNNREGDLLLKQACDDAHHLEAAHRRPLLLAWLHRRTWWNLGQAANGDPRGPRAEAHVLLEKARPLVVSASDEIDQQYYELWLRRAEQPRDPGLEGALRHVIDQARRESSLHGQVRLLTQLVQYLTLAGRPEAIAEARTLLEVARQTFDLRMEVSAHVTLATTLQRLGEASEAAATYERAATLYKLQGNLQRGITCQLARTEVLLDAELYKQATQPLEQLATTLAEHCDRVSLNLHYRMERAQLHLRRGLKQKEGLEVALLDLRARCHQHEFRSIELNTCLELARLRLEEDQTPEVIRWLIQSEYLLGEDDGPEQVKLDHLWSRLLGEDLPNVLEWATTTPQPRNLPPRFYQALTRQISHIRSRVVVDELGAVPRSSIWWLNHVKGLLDRSTQPENFVARVVELAGSLLGGRGAVILFHERYPQQIFGSELPRPQVVTFSHTLLREVLKTRRMKCVPDIALDPVLSQASSLRGVGCGVICHPILEHNTVVGAVYLTWDNNTPDTQVQSMASTVAGLVESSLRELYQHHVYSAGDGAFDPDFPAGTPEIQQLLDQVSELADSEAKSLQVALLTSEDQGQASRLIERMREQVSHTSGELVTVAPATMDDDEFDRRLTDRDGDSVASCWFARVGNGILHFPDIKTLSLSKQQILADYLHRGTFKWNNQEERKKEPDAICCKVLIQSTLTLEELEAQHLILPKLRELARANLLRIPPLVECGPKTIETLLTVEALRIRQEAYDAEECIQNHPLSTWFTPECCRILRTYSWPGSYTELRQLLSYTPIFLKVRQPERGLVEPSDLPPSFQRITTRQGHCQMPPGLTMSELKENLERCQQHYVLEQWQRHRCNSVRTAEMMGCTRQWVDKQLRNLGIKDPSPAEQSRISPETKDKPRSWKRGDGDS